MKRSRREVLKAGAALAVVAGIPGRAFAQQGPVKVGMSMPQTGTLGAGGQAALVALRMWVDDVNQKGGLLGRKVEFIAYDDQSNPANTPGIYTKLLDVDRVDLLIAPYGTVPTAPVMPLAKQRGLLLMGNFSFQVNAKVQHDMWFNNSPWNDAASWSDGFMKNGQKLGAKSIAFLAADQEFAQNLANGARVLAKKANMKAVYDQNYPPTTTDFSSLIRGIRAAKPDMVFVMSYPNDSVAIVRAVNEIGVGSGVKMFGGGMVGLQFTPIMSSLGSLLNGIVNYNSYVPGMKYPGIEDFLQRYAKKAAEAKVDPLGFYLPPFNYAIGQMLEQAVNGTKSLDHKRMAEYLRKNEMKTIVGPIRYDKSGEWANPRVVQAQFRGVVDKDIEQFRKPGKQVVVYPDQYKTGDVIAPFEKARKAK
ncbi:MAG: branched-chain amino acid ABC transporter substrate-binding protein [Betaproteobacteria bacterium RIFCSPLOWO2_12_FULL_65_14]|nr:MAG: branched-chain amino acid ABC transporter substrate-binding protein [Betaproteobacteria bacterium RIFCSPLOWO2_12_FULL_65_14]